MNYTKDEFRRIALDNRYELLRSLSYFSRRAGQGPASSAYAVTQEAIKRGFVAQRKPVSGIVFDGWIRDKNPPAWAVRGALFLLLDEAAFSPSENEMASIALTLAELFPDKNEGELLAFLQGQLATLPWSEVVSLACKVRKSRIKKLS
ncbi:MAG: hypothetical protein MI976_11365 [Pseudomonadales bacterium]|nr:hypothetical protein [Pseudomonadales bacterium]